MHYSNTDVAEVVSNMKSLSTTTLSRKLACNTNVTNLKYQINSLNSARKKKRDPYAGVPSRVFGQSSKEIKSQLIDTGKNNENDCNFDNFGPF